MKIILLSFAVAAILLSGCAYYSDFEGNAGSLTAQENKIPKTAYFEFTDSSGDTFIFKLSDAGKISQAREIIKKDLNFHVAGKITKKSAPYNPKYSFYLEPETIIFFENAPEVCDSSIEYLQKHLREACGSFLPDCRWCPWNSRITREVKSIS